MRDDQAAALGSRLAYGMQRHAIVRSKRRFFALSLLASAAMSGCTGGRESETLLHFSWHSIRGSLRLACAQGHHGPSGMPELLEAKLPCNGDPVILNSQPFPWNSAGSSQHHSSAQHNEAQATHKLSGVREDQRFELKITLTRESCAALALPNKAEAAKIALPLAHMRVEDLRGPISTISNPKLRCVDPQLLNGAGEPMGSSDVIFF